jgi:hypothetical protein
MWRSVSSPQRAYEALPVQFWHRSATDIADAQQTVRTCTTQRGVSAPAGTRHDLEAWTRVLRHLLLRPAHDVRDLGLQCSEDSGARLLCAGDVEPRQLQSRHTQQCGEMS